MFHKLINKQLNIVVRFLVNEFYLVQQGNVWAISSQLQIHRTRIRR